jgi:hypothetical protein
MFSKSEKLAPLAGQIAHAYGTYTRQMAPNAAQKVHPKSQPNDTFDDILLDSLKMETSSLCAVDYQNRTSRTR